MKQFLKFMFASMFGVFLSVALVIIILISIVGGMISSSKEDTEPKIADKSILELNFKNEIKDHPSNNPFENIDFSNFENRTPISLKDILDNIKKAKTDDRIKGIYLNIGSLSANMANTEEIRNALVGFKESGKFIVSYSEDYAQGEYYLCSVADKIYLSPAGGLTFKGLGATLLFFKDALSRLDLDMQVIRHGKFKSAVEPFIRNDMSDANRAQYSELLNGIWKVETEAIAKSRNLSVEKLNQIADSLSIRTAKDAQTFGLVDGLLYADEVKIELKILSQDTTNDEDLRLVSLKDYKKTKVSLEIAKSGREKWNSKNKIAIIYAEGEIISGKSKDGSIGSVTISEAIRKARKDDDIKAILLRVNSPGGGALASDIIWREVIMAKKEKPVVVSMGGLAASGGYYISCAANKIFAENSTITGSIGVFGLIPNIKGLLENKMGIHTDQVTTNSYSDGMTILRPLKPKEREAIQESVESIYGDFTKKVAEGRGMSQAAVDSIGQGRVWSGLSAKRIGLVDEIGGMEEAIVAAADLAKLDDYKLESFPKQKDPFEKIISQFATKVRLQVFGSEYGQAEKYYNNIKMVMESNGIYTRMPVDLIIEQ